ncbi:uncharacterized protein LOC129944886 [Eupeodes corollae]|uniref:uncharacterized protein LOC129944886 n=1 Tax=Eupeodes corollae TaxID=290404 RepID=UPI002492B1C9|nr:uncharacterized protein LOC129944886 [Eupeodes corollae]
MLVVNETYVDDWINELHFLSEEIRVRKFILILTTSPENLHPVFEFFAEEKFTRIFGSTGAKLYAFYPYAPNSIQEVLPAQPVPHALRNLNGLKFRSAFNQDIPKVYRYFDEYGQEKIGGYIARLFKNFLQRHNATVTQVKIKDLKTNHINTIVQATLSNEIDISLNTYSPVRRLESSYPFYLLNWVILVPANRRLDSNEYFLRPFSPTVWLCFALTFIYLISVNVLRNIFSGRPANIWQCFSELYLTMLNMPTERPINRGYLIQIQIEIFAFILINVYLVYLTSFLTIFIKIHQYRTIGELIENNFPVLLIFYEWHTISTSDKHPTNFEKIVRLVDYQTFINEAYSSTNNSHGLAIGSDVASFLMEYQKTKRVVEGSLECYHLGFLLLRNSPFLEILNIFIIDVMQTGLIDKWQYDVRAEVTKLRLINKTRVGMDGDKLLPLTLYHLKFAWICLSCGLILAALVFACEHLITTVLLKFRYIQ